MAGLKEIKSRLASVKNTKKTTYAMKLVSAAKLRRVQETVVSSREYSDELDSLLTDLTAGDGVVSHPLMVERANASKVLLVVIGGSRGLAGGYNSNLDKASERFFAEEVGARGCETIIVGKKPAEYFRRVGRSYLQSYEDLSEDPFEWPLDSICSEIINGFLDREFDEVYLLYTHFKSALSVTPRVERVLPLTREASGGGNPKTIFEPSREAVLDELLPRIFQTKVRQACFHAKASEHGSRMTAMDAATNNAGDLIYSLKLKYNKLRQSGITSELLDIIGGAEAVQ